MDFKVYEAKYGISLEEFVSITNDSTTATQASDRLGLPFKTYRRIAKKLNVYKHSTKKQGKHGIHGNPIPLEEILSGLHPQYGTNILKHRLIKAGIKENKCEWCLIVDWRGEPIVMQLDHINGNSSDHRLENLRILCPNCHSQTETYAAKKRKEITIRKNVLPEVRRKVEKIEKQNQIKHKLLIKEIEESGIAFHRFGWVKAVSLIIGIQPQKVGQWMKKNMPDVYSRCYKR